MEFYLIMNLPEEEVTDGIAAVHRIEEITDLRILPDEWALNVGKPDVAHLNIVDELRQGVADFFE